MRYRRRGSFRRNRSRFGGRRRRGFRGRSRGVGYRSGIRM